MSIEVRQTNSMDRLPKALSCNNVLLEARPCVNDLATDVCVREPEMSRG